MDNKAMIAIAITFMVIVPIGLGYVLNFEDVTHTTWKEEPSANITNFIANSSMDYYTPYTGVLNNYYAIYPGNTQQQLEFMTITNTKTSIPVLAVDYVQTKTINSNNVGDCWLYHDLSVPIPGTVDYTISLNANKGWDVYIAEDQLGVNYHLIDSIPPNSYDGVQPSIQISSTSNGKVVIFGQEYSNSSYDFAIVPSTSVVGDYQFLTVTVFDNLHSGYADPAYGWHSTTLNQDIIWVNGQANDSIRYILEMPAAAASIRFGTAAGSNITLTTDGTTVTYSMVQQPGNVASSGSVGDYKYLMLEVDTNSCIISGLAAWPSMGVYPTTYNRVNISMIDFDMIAFDTFNTSSSDIILRVDQSSIIAGSYPIVNNQTVNIGNMYPAAASYKMTIYNPQTVGDQLTFGGETYTVTDNKITVNDNQISINRIELTSRTADNVTWTNYINGTEISQTNSLSTIGFSGSWSAAYILNILTAQDTVTQEWHSGHFALDLSGAAMIGIATAAAMFIILGMTGKASGSKALILGIVCGLGALVFAMMI